MKSEVVKVESPTVAEENPLSQAEMNRMFQLFIVVKNRLNDSSIDPVRSRFRNLLNKDFLKLTSEMSISVLID